MTFFRDLNDLREACQALPRGDDHAAEAARARQLILTKPPGSLGKLEDLAVWLARWQGREIPRLESVEILVFAGNHGVVTRGVSAYPPEVTSQMVANFAAGGAAINQLAGVAGANLRVVPLDLETPTRDITVALALDEAEFLTAVETGYGSVGATRDLLALGEMGIGNTTSAAALAAALFGGGGQRWAGLGTGLDEAGLLRKQVVVDAALSHHSALLHDPLLVAMALGGRELAAILGAVLAARLRRTPLLLDGFVCTAAVAPLARIEPGGLDHTRIAHRSAEAGHQALAAALDLEPILDLGMRLGEASGAAVAIAVLRAAVACHTGMATFAEAGVRNRA
jgi:nicotinate-nucleotide--dimethylbenzimidazole phosphoribosyltransferase